MLINHVATMAQNSKNCINFYNLTPNTYIQPIISYLCDTRTTKNNSSYQNFQNKRKVTFY